MNHVRATEQIILSMLQRQPIVRFGSPVRFVRNGRGLYSIVTANGSPFGAPDRASLRTVLDWVIAEQGLEVAS